MNGLEIGAAAFMGVGFIEAGGHYDCVHELG